VNIEDLLREWFRPSPNGPDGSEEGLREEFIRACRQVDESPAEQQRIDDMADLLDAQEMLYAQARAAHDRGDTDTAVVLLRQCAEADTGEATWLLAQLLEQNGAIPEATV
jgi:hypothetical protein